MRGIVVMNVYTHVGWVMRRIAVMNVYIHVGLGHARNRCDECLHMNDRESMNIYVCIYEQLRSAAASDRESHGEHSYTTIHPACMRGEWWAGVSLLGGGGACLLTPRVGQITEQTSYKIRK